MEWKMQQEQDVSLIKGRGRLDFNTANNFKKYLKETVEQGQVKIVLDITDVSFIDSSGLGAIVAGLRAANQAGGDVKLAGLSPQIRMIFELARLHKVFEITETAQEAVKAF
jgi:anti-sigma B factor antagonist